MFNIFKKKRQNSQDIYEESTSSQALIVRYAFDSNDDFGSKEELEALYKLEDELEVVLENSSFDLDGHDIGEGEFILYFYGDSADKMLELIIGTLRKSPFMWFSITLRYGPVTDKDAKEKSFRINPKQS